MSIYKSIRKTSNTVQMGIEHKWKKDKFDIAYAEMVILNYKVRNIN